MRRARPTFVFVLVWLHVRGSSEREHEHEHKKTLRSTTEDAWAVMTQSIRRRHLRQGTSRTLTVARASDRFPNTR